MSSFRFVRRSRRVASIVAVLLLSGLVGREHDTLAQTLASKVTSVLADVAAVIPQDDPSRPPPTESFQVVINGSSGTLVSSGTITLTVQ